MFTGTTNPFNTTSSKAFENFKLPEVDYESVTHACKQNLEAFKQTQEHVLNTWHSLSEMQARFAHQAIEGMGSFMKNFKNAKTVEEKTQLQSQAFKDGIEKVASHTRNVTDQITKTNNDISSKLGQTVSENINQASEALKKTNKSF